jgi:hypothetical protein
MESENSREKNQPAVADRIAGEIASLKNPPPPIDPYKIAARQAAERLLRRLGIKCSACGCGAPWLWRPAGSWHHQSAHPHYGGEVIRRQEQAAQQLTIGAPPACGVGLVQRGSAWRPRQSIR